jgi:hypothetical protein
MRSVIIALGIAVAAGGTPSQPRRNIASPESGLAAVRRFHDLTFADSASFDLCDLKNAYDPEGRLRAQYKSLSVVRTSRAECDVPFTDEKPFIGAKVVSMTVKGDSLIVETIFKRNSHVGWRERYAIIANRGTSTVSHVMEYRVTVLTVI